MKARSIVAALVLLTNGILAGEKSFENLNHGHSLQWLKKIKEERSQASDP
jgi:hypothetical protein